jgi:hypothetical protein
VVIADLLDSMMECESEIANVFGGINSKRDKTDFPPSPMHTDRANQPSLPGGILKGGAFETDCGGPTSWRGGGRVAQQEQAVDDKQSVSASLSSGNNSNMPSVRGQLLSHKDSQLHAHPAYAILL